MEYVNNIWQLCGRRSRSRPIKMHPVVTLPAIRAVVPRAPSERAELLQCWLGQLTAPAWPTFEAPHWQIVGERSWRVGLMRLSSAVISLPHQQTMNLGPSADLLNPAFLQRRRGEMNHVTTLLRWWGKRRSGGVCCHLGCERKKADE